MRNIYINSILITLAIIQISTFTTHYHGYTKNSRRRTISLSSAVLESSTSKNNRSFHQRMRNLVSPVKKPTSNKRRLKNMYVAHTLEDYKLLVGDEKDQIVIVRFFATWCKACQAIGPSFYRLAKQYQHIKFVQVPVKDSNADLHQGLNVPSLPFAHIYIPKEGHLELVEEMKISKKYFRDFEDVVQSYVESSCVLEDCSQ